MPVKFDETYEPRPWRCGECRTVLGVVMHDTDRVLRLWIFRMHKSDDQMPKTFTLHNAPRGLFSVHGVDNIPRPGGVECQHCGALNDWAQSKESFLRLMSHYQELQREPV